MEKIDAAHYFKIIMVIQQGPKNRKKEFFRVWQISLLSIWILIMTMVISLSCYLIMTMLCRL